MTAWNNQNTRGTMLKENVVLRDTLDRKEKEYKRMQHTFDHQLKVNERWEEDALNSRMQELQNENHRLRG